MEKATGRCGGFLAIVCFALFADALFGPATIHAETLIIDTVAIYDADSNDNTIDEIASGSIDLETFTANVAAAFDNGRGGVIDFEGPTLNGIDRIEARFAGSDETLILTNADESTWTTNTGSGRTPTSGDNVLGKHCATSPECTNDHWWSVGPVTSGEVVKSMGVTVLSGLKGPFDIMVLAGFDDGSTQSLEAFLPQSNGLDDTFFAIEAPAGRHITTFAVFNGPPLDPDNVGSFGSIDDLAFIVDTLITGTPCDFDQNGACDLDDIDSLVAQMATGGVDLLFDVNGDSAVDTLDIDEWRSLAATENGFASPYLPGDANLDGSVDAQDLNAMGVNWQQSVATWSAGDFSANGVIGAEDLNVLGLNWQASISAAGASAVPEPAAVVLWLIAGAALLPCRRGCPMALSTFESEKPLNTLSRKGLT